MVKLVAFIVALVVGTIGGFVVAAIGGFVYLEFVGDPGNFDNMSNAFAYGPKGALIGAIVAAVAMWRQLRKSPEQVAAMMAQGGPRADKHDHVTRRDQM